MRSASLRVNSATSALRPKSMIEHTKSNRISVEPIRELTPIIPHGLLSQKNRIEQHYAKMKKERLTALSEREGGGAKISQDWDGDEEEETDNEIMVNSDTESVSSVNNVNLNNLPYLSK